jgi:hypothetical protein
VKLALGSIIFLASMYLMRQVLIASGIATPTVAFLFLVAAAGIPLGGLVLMEGALEHEARDLRARLDVLEKRLAEREEEPPAPR